jgi:hypothetical protein
LDVDCGGGWREVDVLVEVVVDDVGNGFLLKAVSEHAGSGD